MRYTSSQMVTLFISLASLYLRFIKLECYYSDIHVYVYIEANEFSAIFVHVKHYVTKVSAAEVEKLTDKLTKYGNAVLG